MANQDGQVLYRVVIDDSNVGSDMRGVENEVEKGTSKLKDKAKSSAKAIGLSLGTIAVGIGAMAIKGADDMDKAMNQFIASTGKGAEEAERYQGVLESIYTNNYGESFEDIADKMGLVNQQMGDLSDEELKRVTEQAYLLQDTFEIEFSESIRGVNALVKQFGISSEEAFELLTQGAQKGLNQNEDLADQVAEYAGHFADLGLTADEFFNSMVNGSADGAFQMDYLNDAVKEFGIRAKDGSDASAEAFQQLGFDAEKMTKTFADGGDASAVAFMDITQALSEVDNAVKQNELGVALFGTKFEDLGVDAINALTDINGEMDMTGDSLKKMEDIKYGSTSEMLEGLKRSVEPLLIDLGQGLIPILQEIATSLMPVVEQLLPVFSELLMGLIPPIAEIIEALLPVFVELIEMLIPPFLQIIEMILPVFLELLNVLIPIFSNIIELLMPLIELFMGLLEPVLTLISQGITPLIEILGRLMKGILDVLIMDLRVVSGVFKEVFSTIVGYVMDQVKLLTSTLSSLIDFIKNVFTGNWSGAWGNVKDIFGNIWEGIKNAFKLPFNVIIGGVNGFLSGLDGIGIPDWVPVVGGKKFSFPYRIPKLAKGGIATDETLATVGDNPNAKIDPEVIAPLSSLKKLLGLDMNRSALDSSKIVYNNITVRDNVIDDSNIDTIGTNFMNKLKRDGNY